MKLTPIKVKGKGGRKPPWKPPQPQGNMRKRGQSEDASSHDGHDGPRPSRRPKTRRPAALIEQLPTEILERIVLLSQNLNVPRSSLRIGFLLSNKSFYTELLVAAFDPTWDLWFGCYVESTHSYADYWEDYQRIGGDPDFQSAVLACPWVDLNLIFEAQQKWYRRDGTQRYFEHIERWPTMLEVEYRTVANPDHQPGLGHLMQDVAACFEADWNHYCARLNSFAMACRFDAEFLDSLEWTSRSNWFIEIHPLTRIPERFLTGPFGWDEAKLLFWFVRGGARALPEYITWESTKRGYENIMSLEDEHLGFVLLYLFYELRVFQVDNWPAFLAGEKAKEAGAHESAQNGDMKGVWHLAKLIMIQTVYQHLGITDDEGDS